MDRGAEAGHLAALRAIFQQPVKEVVDGHCSLASTTSAFLVKLGTNSELAEGSDIVRSTSDRSKKSAPVPSTRARISEDVLGVPPSLMNKSTRAALGGYLCSENTKKELEILPAVEREELLSLCGNDEITASSIHSQLVTLKMAALQSPESLRARSIPGNYKALLSFIRSEVRSRVMSSTPPAECLPHTIAIPYFSDWDDEVLCYVRAGRCSETLLVFAQSLDGTWRLAYGEDNPRLVAPKRDKILENQMAIVNLRDPE